MSENEDNQEQGNKAPNPLSLSKTGNLGSSWKPIRSAQELVERFEQHPWLEQEIKNDPRVLAAVLQSPLETDKVIYRIVVLALGCAVLASLFGIIWLAYNKITPTPEGLVAIGSAAGGALAGLLAPSPSRKAE